MDDPSDSRVDDRPTTNLIAIFSKSKEKHAYLTTSNREYFNKSIARTCCHVFAVIVELSVVDGVHVARLELGTGRRARHAFLFLFIPSFSFSWLFLHRVILIAIINQWADVCLIYSLLHTVECQDVECRLTFVVSGIDD